MDTSRVIRLLKVDFITDDSGTQHETITSDRTVFCRIRSVGVKEAYAAMEVGRNPEIIADIPEGSMYSGENFAVFGGNRFRVLRSYIKGSRTELTLERTRDLDGVI